MRVEIERLLKWAYQDELLKRATSSAEAVWDSIGEARLGIVGERSYSQRYDHGAPHPDALIIERAVAQLPDVVIDWRLDADVVLGDLGALCELAGSPGEEPPARPTQVSWPAKCGARASKRLAPQRSAILLGTLRAPALVTQHAVMGSRPDWMDEVPVPEAIPAIKGPHALVVGYAIRKGWYSEGSYCPLRWRPSPLTIAQARADYLAWWRSLLRLSREIRLTTHEALPPAAAQYPWQAANSLCL